MANVRQLTREERETLLVEYQTCQQESDSNSSNFWTLASVFIGVSSVILGALIYGIIANIDSIPKITDGNACMFRTIIIVVGLGMVAILAFLWSWLKRTQYLMDVNYDRMREIELELQMQKGWRLGVLDSWRKLKLKKPDTLRDKEIDDLWNKLSAELKKRLLTKYHTKLDERKQELVQLCVESPSQHWYEKPSREMNIKVILWILIGLWIFLIVMALLVVT